MGIDKTIVCVDCGATRDLDWSLKNPSRLLCAKCRDKEILVVAHVHELRTDGQDIVAEWVEIIFTTKDGENGSLRFSLEGAYELRGILDAVPELDGKNW